MHPMAYTVAGSSVPGVRLPYLASYFLFFFNDTATTEIYTLSLHDALPICRPISWQPPRPGSARKPRSSSTDRKSTRLNSSHTVISYAVFCLKKKKNASCRPPPRRNTNRTRRDSIRSPVHPRRFYARRSARPLAFFLFFFFNDRPPTEIYTLSLHDALPIFSTRRPASAITAAARRRPMPAPRRRSPRSEEHTSELQSHSDLVCRLLLEK